MRRELAALFAAIGLSVALGLGQLTFSPTVEAAYPGATNPGIISPTCSPDGTAAITFVWSTYNQGSQWVDVSTTNDEFASVYMTLGPLTPNQSSTAWNELKPGTWYFMRVNTLTPTGWWPSETITFLLTAECSPSSSVSPATTYGQTFPPMPAALPLTPAYVPSQAFAPVPIFIPVPIPMTAPPYWRPGMGAAVVIR